MKKTLAKIKPISMVLITLFGAFNVTGCTSNNVHKTNGTAMRSKPADKSGQAPQISETIVEGKSATNTKPPEIKKDANGELVASLDKAADAVPWACLLILPIFHRCYWSGGKTIYPPYLPRESKN